MFGNVNIIYRVGKIFTQEPKQKLRTPEGLLEKLVVPPTPDEHLLKTEGDLFGIINEVSISGNKAVLESAISIQSGT